MKQQMAGKYDPTLTGKEEYNEEWFDEHTCSSSLDYITPRYKASIWLGERIPRHVMI